MVEGRRLLQTTFCWCGCGQRTKRLGSFFVGGHDRKAESWLIKMHYGSVPQFLLDHGYGPDGKNLKDEWEQFEEREQAEG